MAMTLDENGFVTIEGKFFHISDVTLVAKRDDVSLDILLGNIPIQYGFEKQEHRDEHYDALVSHKINYYTAQREHHAKHHATTERQIKNQEELVKLMREHKESGECPNA